MPTTKISTKYMCC